MNGLVRELSGVVRSTDVGQGTKDSFLGRNSLTARELHAVIASAMMDRAEFPEQRKRTL